MLTVSLESGTSEVLAANLLRETFPEECFKEIYQHS